MSNYGAKIFNNAVSSLWANQALLANTSNNIANVNTEGYARRTLTLQTRLDSGRGGGLNLGNGVEIGSLNRISDQFLNGAARQSTGNFNNHKTQGEYLQRVEAMFDLTGNNNTIGSTLSKFYDALNDLSTNPASLELRANFIDTVEDVATAIRQTYQGIADLQAEADSRLAVEIDNVNSFTAQIAEFNEKIKSREKSGDVAADERDRRDQLLEELSERISFNHVENSDGTVTISLPNGFPLVSGGNSRELEVTRDPSFGGGDIPPSLNGEALSYVVYDYDQGGGNAHIDLTQYLKDGSGTIGGLLTMRGHADPANTSAFEADGELVDMAARVEAITRELLTTVNATYFASDGGAPPSSTAGDLEGNPPDVFGLFTFDGAPVAGLPDDAALAGTGIDSFSMLIQGAVTDPTRVAAARDTGDGFAEGDASNLNAIAELQDQTMSVDAGNYSGTGSLSEIYNQLVGKVGNLSSRSQVDSSVAQDNLITAQNRRDQVQGVSLDEEFANLIKHQKGFEASSRLIRLGSELLDTIVGLI